MKFSVLIPLYNKAAYIRETLDSVFAQTYADFEVIVVDDGSSDGGADVAASFDDRRLRVVRQINSGVAVARNFGISLAKGDWVVFLDADDWHHPQFLQWLIEAENQYPMADTLGSQYLEVPDTGGHVVPVWPALAQRPEVELITDLPTRWMSGPTLCASSVAVKAERLRSMQPCFPPGESRGEDLDLWFRLAEKAPVALVCAPLAAYRVDVKGSLTAQPRALVLAPFVHRMYARAVSGQLTQQQRTAALWMVAQHELNLAREALAAGKRIDSMRWLFRSRHAASGRRWWMTMALTLMAPGSVVKSWGNWRVKRPRAAAAVVLRDGK